MTSTDDAVIAAADTDAGAAAARARARTDASVVLVGSDAGRLGELARELQAEHGVRAPVYVGEARDAAVSELAEELLR